MSPIALAALYSLVIFLAGVLVATPLHAQVVQTGDPIKRGLSASDFPRAKQLVPGVYSYEALRAGDPRRVFRAAGRKPLGAIRGEFLLDHLLVVSLPASDRGVSPHIQAEDVEVGGIHGRQTLDRLRHVIRVSRWGRRVAPAPPRPGPTARQSPDLYAAVKAVILLEGGRAHH